MSAVSEGVLPSVEASRPDVREIHVRDGGFVWATLQRLGARHPDLDDLYQEVFVVVHRRLDQWNPSLPLRPWLYGICVRVSAGWRRRAHRRYESLTETPDTAADDAPSPEEASDVARRRQVLHALLDELDLERRAVFVMHEIDGLSCEQIAAETGAPLGTVYTRLTTARKDLQRAAMRWHHRHPAPR